LKDFFEILALVVTGWWLLIQGIIDGFIFGLVVIYMITGLGKSDLKKVAFWLRVTLWVIGFAWKLSQLN